MKDSKFTRMLRNLREKMKPMTLPQKIGYLWFVFKDYALVASAVVILLGAAIVSGINMNIETLIAGVSVNVPMNDFGVAYLSDDYGKVLGAVENKAEVTFITTQVASSDSSGNMEYNHNVISQLVAQAAAGSLDYVIMSKDAMEILFSEDMFLDLREILTPEQLQQWEEKIVYLVIEEGGEEVPVALDLKGTSFSDDCISRRNS
jgi:hypothetical protein